MQAVLGAVVEVHRLWACLSLVVGLGGGAIDALWLGPFMPLSTLHQAVYLPRINRPYVLYLLC